MRYTIKLHAYHFEPVRMGKRKQITNVTLQVSIIYCHVLIILEYKSNHTDSPNNALYSSRTSGSLKNG